MSENKFETVSSLVDDYQPNHDDLSQLLNNDELSETWQRYHLISDVLKDDAPEHINLDLSGVIASAIADEPTVLAPKTTLGVAGKLKAKVVHLVKPFGQVAIAASAAGLMVVGVQQNVAQQESVIPQQQVVQTTPMLGSVQPVSLNFQQNNRASQKQAIIEQQRRFQALLQDHQQQIKLSAAELAEQQEENNPPQ